MISVEVHSQRWLMALDEQLAPIFVRGVLLGEAEQAMRVLPVRCLRAAGCFPCTLETGRAGNRHHEVALCVTDPVLHLALIVALGRSAELLGEQVVAL